MHTDILLFQCIIAWIVRPSDFCNSDVKAGLSRIFLPQQGSTDCSSISTCFGNVHFRCDAGGLGLYEHGLLRASAQGDLNYGSMSGSEVQGLIQRGAFPEKSNALQANTKAISPESFFLELCLLRFAHSMAVSQFPESWKSLPRRWRTLNRVTSLELR